MVPIVTCEDLFTSTEKPARALRAVKIGGGILPPLKKDRLSKSFFVAKSALFMQWTAVKILT